LIALCCQDGPFLVVVWPGHTLEGKWLLNGGIKILLATFEQQNCLGMVLRLCLPRLHCYAQFCLFSRW
jgi:hypothetical protein